MQTNFQRDGYVIVKEFIAKDIVEEIMDDIKSVFKIKFESDNFRYENDDASLIEYYQTHQDGFVGCMREIQRLPSIYNFGTRKEVLEMLKKIGLIKPVVSQEPIVMLNNEKTSRRIGDWKTPSHQDWRSRQGSLNSVTCWIGLVDITQEVGPVEIIPGSHFNGLLPTEKDDWYMHISEKHLEEEDFVPVPINAGDAIIFSQLLIHRSGTNISNKMRYSLQYRYDDIAEKTFVDRNYPNSRGSQPSYDLITPDFPNQNDMENYFKTDS